MERTMLNLFLRDRLPFENKWTGQVMLCESEKILEWKPRHKAYRNRERPANEMDNGRTISRVSSTTGYKVHEASTFATLRLLNGNEAEINMDYFSSSSSDEEDILLNSSAKMWYSASSQQKTFVLWRISSSISGLKKRFGPCFRIFEIEDIYFRLSFKQTKYACALVQGLKNTKVFRWCQALASTYARSSAWRSVMTIYI